MDPQEGACRGSHHRFSLITDVSIPLTLSLPLSDINKANDGLDRNFGLRWEGQESPSSGFNQTESRPSASEV